MLLQTRIEKIKNSNTKESQNEIAKAQNLLDEINTQTVLSLLLLTLNV